MEIRGTGKQGKTCYIDLQKLIFCEILLRNSTWREATHDEAVIFPLSSGLHSMALRPLKAKLQLKSDSFEISCMVLPKVMVTNSKN